MTHTLTATATLDMIDFAKLVLMLAAFGSVIYFGTRYLVKVQRSDLAAHRTKGH